MGTLSLSVCLMVVAMASSAEVAVLPIQTAAVAPDRALAMADRVAEVLRAEGVSVAGTPSEVAAKLRAEGTDPFDCRGEASCAARLAAKLGAGLAVGMGVGEFEGSVAVHLEAIDVAFAERSLVEDQILPADVKDPLWGRALAPFARKIRQRAEAIAAAAPPPPPAASAGDWVIGLQVDAELGDLGGMITARAGRRLFPALTVSAGATATGGGFAGVAVQARVMPFAADRLVHPVLALEVPVLFRSSAVAGVRPSAGVEVTPLPWLALTASASYLQLFGSAAELRLGYWLAGAEVGFRL